MKPLTLIPPVVAIVIGGIVVVNQNQSIATLELETAHLRARITSARETPGSSLDPLPSARLNQLSDEKKIIDWKKIATELSETNRNSGISDIRKTMAFQRRLQAMSANELVNALDEIRTLDLSDEDRGKLEMMILGPLSDKDPELALTRFSDRLKDDKSGLSWQLGNALGQWADKDMSAATAWFEKEIAAGTFLSKSLDGKSSTLNQFESQLISRMLFSDFSGAEKRMEKMPMEMRRDILRSYGFQRIKEDDQAAFAKLVRSQLDEKQSLGILGDKASTLARKGDFREVDAYMDRIEATPKERMTSAENAAKGFLQSKGWQGKITATDVDTMRDWLGKQSPGAVDRLTGESLGNASSGGDETKFSDASALALKYNKSSSNDDVLIGFLENSITGANKSKARELAEKILDPVKREKALNDLK